MPDADDTIRQQLTDARRNQIMEAAVDVFAAKGFSRATTREIAAAAKVSEGTIYNYFTGKADILTALVLRLVEMKGFNRGLAHDPGEAPESVLRRTIETRMRLIEQNLPIFQAILSEVLVDKELGRCIRERLAEQALLPLEGYLNELVDRGLLRPINVPLVVTTMQGMFFGLLVLRLLGEGSVVSAWRQLPDVVADLVFHGVFPCQPSGAAAALTSPGGDAADGDGG
ncbi:MAG: TetR/AcrR family transcriptional regulator [Anaerolineae bacterium]